MFQPWGRQGKARLAIAWAGVQLDTTREVYFPNAVQLLQIYGEKYKQNLQNTPVIYPN